MKGICVVNGITYKVLFNISIAVEIENDSSFIRCLIFVLSFSL